MWFGVFLLSVTAVIGAGARTCDSVHVAVSFGVQLSGDLCSFGDVLRAVLTSSFCRVGSNGLVVVVI